MSAYNAESALARLLRPHYARGDDEARALLREAFTLSGDLQISDHTLHVRLDPASAPRRSRALAALCNELTTTGTRYPGTDLSITYSVQRPARPCMIQFTMSGVLESEGVCRSTHHEHIDGEGRGVGRARDLHHLHGHDRGDPVRDRLRDRARAAEHRLVDHQRTHDLCTTFVSRVGRRPTAASMVWADDVLEGPRSRPIMPFARGRRAASAPAATRG